MNNNNLPSWVAPVAIIVLALVALNMLLNIGLGLIGMIFGIIGSILGFAFSKGGLFLISVALVYYIWNNRGEKRRSYDSYDVY